MDLHDSPPVHLVSLVLRLPASSSFTVFVQVPFISLLPSQRTKKGTLVTWKLCPLCCRMFIHSYLVFLKVTSIREAEQSRVKCTVSVVVAHKIG